MTDRVALPLLGLAALLLVPGVAAFGVASPLGGDQAAETLAVPASPPLADALSMPDAGAPGTALENTVVGKDPIATIVNLTPTLPTAGQSPLTVSVNAGASANVDVSTSPGDGSDPAGDTPATSPSLGAQLAHVAAPAAGISFIAVVAGALALGAEGLRVLQGRIAGLLGRFGRVLGALFLFSRIERSALLDNPVRARVHQAVAQDPGLSLSEVSTRAGIAWGTTVHHLRRLEANGMVVSESRLAHRRYFIANTPAAEQRTAVAVVMHPTARRIAHLVNQRPGIDQTGICHALALANPAASKHLSKFEAEGLIVSQRVGRGRHYHGTTTLDSALRLVESSPPPLSDHPTALQPAPVAGAC